MGMSEDDVYDMDSDQIFSNREAWIREEDGQLAVDVYETADNLVIKAAIAGVQPKDIDISIHEDMLTIRGKREAEEQSTEYNYLYRECYWGSFSRSIILPVEAYPDRISAVIKTGILTIIIPKAKRYDVFNIEVAEG